MTQRLEHFNFLLQFLHGQLAPLEVGVGMFVAAIITVIDTIIAYIQRCKNNDALAVNFFFDFLGRRKNTAPDPFIPHMQQHSRFLVG
ncbi:hypothetical protein D3C75_977260 [compost metagenome]